MRGVLARGLRVLIVGVAVGIVITLAFIQVVQPLLFETEGMDPIMFISVSILLIAAGIGASIIPARRAMQVDPMVALRVE